MLLVAFAFLNVRVVVVFIINVMVACWLLSIRFYLIILVRYASCKYICIRVLVVGWRGIAHYFLNVATAECATARATVKKVKFV